MKCQKLILLVVLGTLVSFVVAPTTGAADEKMQRLKVLVEDRAAQTDAQVQERKTGTLASRTSEPPSSEISGLRVLQGLFLTLGVFFVGVWGYQKLNRHALPKSGSRRMKLVERVAVGPKTALVLAEIDGRSVLMSVGSERVAFFSDSAWLEGAWDKEQGATAEQS